jgi:hypothetical protein
MLDSWDLMDWNPPLPYVTLGQRLELGFVKPAWVKAYDFASHNGLPVDETVTLEAIETGQPPANRFSGIEVRVADGWNYYFEYRKGQMAQEGDKQLPTDSAVLGTDMVAPPWNPPFARPQILLLGPGGDGPVLVNGEGYKETDFTDPMFPADFRADVSGIDGTKADVRIRYGANGKPDPSIRPWPAGPGRDWQSPDIEVKNMKNQADPCCSTCHGSATTTPSWPESRTPARSMLPASSPTFPLKTSRSRVPRNPRLAPTRTTLTPGKRSNSLRAGSLPPKATSAWSCASPCTRTPITRRSSR